MLEERVRRILQNALHLGAGFTLTQPGDALLGAVPELDSMAVVVVLTAIEDEFGIMIEDDEVSAETFETLGSLVEFVRDKTGPYATDD